MVWWLAHVTWLKTGEKSVRVDEEDRAQGKEGTGQERHLGKWHCVDAAAYTFRQ